MQVTSKYPNVTIVIVNWNGGEFLIACLDSIRRSRAAFPFNVIVVDNDSADGSREEAQRRFPTFKIFNSGANLGFGRANNLTRSLIEGGLVLFLNPDTELRESTLQVVVDEMLARENVGALACKIVDEKGEVQPLGLQWFPNPWTALVEVLFVTTQTPKSIMRLLPVRDPMVSASVDKLYGGFLLIPKEVMDAVGWFDERYFMYAEDADLSRSIRARGLQLYYTVATEVLHLGAASSDKAPSGFAILMKLESINKMITKYHGGLAAFLHRLVILFGSLVRMLVLSICAIWTLRRIPGGKRWGAFGLSTMKYRNMFAWALGVRRAKPSGKLAAAN